MNIAKHLASDEYRQKPLVRILLRVSSRQQLEADGDLDIQRKLILDYIREHPDWILDGKEYFEGGISGYKNSVEERDVLQEAYRDAENREYDILVLYKDDRLGRRMFEIPVYIMSLKNLGVDVYTVKDGILSANPDDITAQMMLTMRYAMAQKSSADTAMRVKDTAKKLIAQGKYMGGNPPYSYHLEYSGEVSKHGRILRQLVISPEQAEAVKYIYYLSLTREYGSAKIASTLNADEHYRQLAPNDVWKSGTITSILTNPIYAGYTAYNRRERLNGRSRNLDSSDWILSAKPNPDIVIIDEDTWLKVQQKREQRGKKYTKSLTNQNVTVISRNDGMLSLVDVLHCGYCGCKMVNGSKYNYWTMKNTGERKTSKVPIYKCQNAWQGVPHDKTKQFRADRIEPIIYSALAEYIHHLLENENIFEEITENNHIEKHRKEKDFAMEQEKLNKIRHNIGILEEHIPDAMTGEYPLSLEDLVRNIDTQKDKEQEQLAVVRQRQADLQNTTVTTADWEHIKGKLPTWRELFLHADTPTKRVLVNKLIERIDITKEQIVVRFKISLDAFLPQSRMDGNGVVPRQGL